MNNRPAMSREEKDNILRDNFLKLRRDLKKRASKWKSRPFAIDIATDNLCNLRCIMCSPDNRPSPQRISPEDMARICEQVLPTATVLAPSIGGEPMLPDIDMIEEQCRRYFVKMKFITNATLLDVDKYKNMRDVIISPHTTLIE